MSYSYLNINPSKKFVTWSTESPTLVRVFLAGTMHRVRRDRARQQGGLTEEQKQEIRCVLTRVQRLHESAWKRATDVPGEQFGRCANTLWTPSSSAAGTRVRTFSPSLLAAPAAVFVGVPVGPEGST